MEGEEEGGGRKRLIMRRVYTQYIHSLRFNFHFNYFSVLKISVVQSKNHIEFN